MMHVMIIYPGFLRSPEEAESSDFPAPLSSHDNGPVHLDVPETDTKRSSNGNRFFEQFSTRCYVLVLPHSGSRTGLPKVLMVEEIHDLDAAGELFQSI